MKHLVRCVVAGLPIFLATGTTAQVVVGTVREAVSDSAVAGVEVTFRSATDSLLATVLSDSVGRFAVTGVGEGRLTISATRLGYRNALAEVEVTANEVVVVELRISREPIVLEPLRVVARERDWARARDLSEYYDRMVRAEPHELGVTMFPRQELARTDGWTYADFMRRSAPYGWTLTRTGAIRGTSQSCSPVLYWNGIQASPDELMSISEIEGIEFYRGFGPPQMRFANWCGGGVILIWSRPLGETENTFTWGRFGMATGVLLIFVALAALAN